MYIFVKLDNIKTLNFFIINFMNEIGDMTNFASE